MLSFRILNLDFERKKRYLSRTNTKLSKWKPLQTTLVYLKHYTL